MLLRFFLSFLGIAAGFMLILKTKEVTQFSGANNWVEKVFGNGQTYSFYKILGVLIIFIFFLYLLGDLDLVLRLIIKVFFP